MKSPLSAALLAALVLAGCGGSDTSPSAAPQAPAATTAATVAAAPTTAAAASTPAAGATTATTTTAAAPAATPALAAATPSVDAASPTCQALTLVPGELSRAFNGVPNADMSGVQSDLDALRHDAPKAIERDISTLDRAYRKLAAGLHGDTENATSGAPDPVARVQKVLATLDVNAINLATSNVGVWLQEHCKS